jgi:thioredoxin reductase
MSKDLSGDVDLTLQADVLIIGGGPSGAWAALAAAESGMLVVLADKRYLKDLSTYPLDGPVPGMPPTDGIHSRQQLIKDLGKRQKLSIR